MRTHFRLGTISIAAELKTTSLSLFIESALADLVHRAASAMAAVAGAQALLLQSCACNVLDHAFAARDVVASIEVPRMVACMQIRPITQPLYRLQWQVQDRAFSRPEMIDRLLAHVDTDPVCLRQPPSATTRTVRCLPSSA